VFDRDILEALPRRDRRVYFIWESVAELQSALIERGGGLHVIHGRAVLEVPKLAEALGVETVFTNRDYEPRAIARDRDVEMALGRLGIGFESVKDTVIFERDEVLTLAGRPFTVFTPFKNAWLKKFSSIPANDFLPRTGSGRWASSGTAMPSMNDLGFESTDLFEWGFRAGRSGGLKSLEEFLPRMAAYKRLRDFPAKKGVSYLGVHLRFGTLSIRELVQLALEQKNEGGEGWLSELIWREFYFQILYHFPYVVNGAFKRDYDALQWDSAPDRLLAWKEGRTGYPIVDAGMRQLLTTGFMHNRLRMITASFLVKDLLIDWREGEAWFARHLNDFDLSANNGGWQWAASTGCDAQPYFRIFNPVSQSEKFDPEGDFIRRYVPELARTPTRYIHAPWLMPPVERAAHGISIPGDYPRPIVDHAVMRQEILQRFKAVPKT
jgi:deoxyribodipyrimidine photo-lyase